MSTRPPWEDYQKASGQPPWEDYRAPPKTRQIPVLTAQGPAGMRPATEEEYQAFHAEQNEGGKQMLTGAAMAATGPLMGAPGIIGAGMRLAANPIVGGGVVAGLNYARTGNPLSAAEEGLKTGALLAVGGRVIPAGIGTSQSLTARILHWIGRNPQAKAAAAEAAPVATAIAAEAPVAAEAPGLRWNGPPTPKALGGPGHFVGEAPAAATAPVVPIAPRVRAPRGPKPAAPVSTTLEADLKEGIRQAGLKLTPGQRAQLKNANALEAEIVQLRATNGLSVAQIKNVLIERFGKGTKDSATGIMPSEAEKLVEMVLQTHGLK